MPGQVLREFLDEQHVDYVRIDHSPAFTAQEIAATTHTPGKEMAKTVMVKVDRQLAMAVVPASLRVDLELLKVATGAYEVELAHESDFCDAFPECEVGAMPPFGNLYGMNVYVAKSLAEDEVIAFNAGSHTELIRITFDDFMRLVEPIVMRITRAD